MGYLGFRSLWGLHGDFMTHGDITPRMENRLGKHPALTCTLLYVGIIHAFGYS